MRNVLEYLEKHSENSKNKSRFEDDVNEITYKAMTLSAKKIGSAISRWGKERKPIAVYWHVFLA